MDEVKTENHLPEKLKEQLHQKVMEMDSQSMELLKKLEKSWKPGIRLILSYQFSADVIDSERYLIRLIKRVKTLNKAV